MIPMKQIPRQDRPYEKCAVYGPGALSDAELLSVLLRTGHRNMSSLELARQILDRANPRGLPGLLHQSLEEWKEIPGIGDVKAVELLCIGEISSRIWKNLTVNEAESFTEPSHIAAYFMESLRHTEQEELHLMLLNTKGLLIREKMIFRGTVNASLASPREIFREAFSGRAVSIVLVHNHPSGNPEPSADDILLTRKVAEGGKILGIPLLDHVIIGDIQYFSFREQGLLSP